MIIGFACVVPTPVFAIACDVRMCLKMMVLLLQAFSIVFEKAIDRAEEAEELKQRVNNLIDCITYSVFVYTSRGLFERDKLTFTAQMTIQILTMSGDISPTELEFLLRFPAITNVYSPVDFLTNTSWGGIKVLNCTIWYVGIMTGLMHWQSACIQAYSTV